MIHKWDQLETSFRKAYEPLLLKFQKLFDHSHTGNVMQCAVASRPFVALSLRVAISRKLKPFSLKKNGVGFFDLAKIKYLSHNITNSSKI